MLGKTVNLKQFHEAALKAKTGHRICYHRGLLMRTRQWRPGADKIGKIAWALHMLHKAVLVQQRVSGYSSDYLLIPISPIRQRDWDEAIRLTTIV